jgi:hypothetical protein
MTPPAEQYPFVEMDQGVGAPSLCPYLPITLSRGGQSIDALGHLDTAAAVNVLPYELGLRLGAVWEEQTVPLRLAGNLAREEARGLLLTAKVGDFPPVALAFAWTKSKTVPVLLGQMNFFKEFDVCFFRSRAVFEVKPKPG